jgi:serine/threonine-protein kinase
MGVGLKLYVDGTEVGELPRTAGDLTAGEHTIKVGGNPRYEDWEKRVQVSPDSLETIGPLKLKVLKGLATFKAGPGADGARVLLDGRVIPELPATIEVPGGKSLSLVATKDGYGTYKRTILFDEGEAERTFEITMVESGGAVSPPSEESSPPPRMGATAQRGGGSRPAAGGGSSSQSSSGKATISLNSIPVSNVIVNGRPMGQTPKIGVKVDAGPQTVVFVHPEHGRKVQSAVVAAGSTKTFMVRFP